MRLRVHHVSHYSYAAPVRGVVQSHRLTPATFEGQKVLNWSVSVSGGVAGGSFRDGAGDRVQGWTVPGPVQQIEVAVTGEVETTDTAGVLRGLRESVPPEVYLRKSAATRPDAALRKLAAEVVAAGGATDPLSLAHALAAAVSDAVVWRPGVTHAGTSASEALARGEGVCQDHAHVLICLARLRGLPARYVTGYLFGQADGQAEGQKQTQKQGRKAQQAQVQGAAEDAAHAWAEVHIAGLGWVGFDPTNRTCPDARYIRLGSGLDAAEAAPIRGIARGDAPEALDVRVAIKDAAQQ